MSQARIEDFERLLKRGLDRIFTVRATTPVAAALSLRVEALESEPKE